MVKTIGNPLSWGAQTVGAAANHLGSAIGKVRRPDATEITEMPVVNTIGTEDLRIALRKGFDDFGAFRSDVLVICFLYPVVGMLLIWFAFDRALLPLLFPLMSGFALIGPVAAVGLYEMSRRREAGQDASWADAFGVLKSPSLGPIIMLGLYLLAILLVWLFLANLIYAATLGPEPPASIGVFLTEVLTTVAGWAMILLGFGVGFIFALAVLAISVVSFPLLIDRQVGLAVAVVTSTRVLSQNPRTICIWGMMVAAGLLIGSIPLLLGLIVIMPVLGHATWHLYRRAVS
ncbi:DUF2189 domain-containing protein [Aliiroseovarius sp. YM-037]|uniref:DUF2189 domain-containing protein n=1 Tax=Aliiroseovarius sp. YM-037 TaxID=3341728 RepID=UPI003A806484